MAEHNGDAGALPPNLALALDVHEGDPLTIVAVDPDTHERFEAPTTRADLEAGTRAAECRNAR